MICCSCENCLRSYRQNEQRGPQRVAALPGSAIVSAADDQHSIRIKKLVDLEVQVKQLANCRHGPLRQDGAAAIPLDGRNLNADASGVKMSGPAHKPEMSGQHRARQSFVSSF